MMVPTSRHEPPIIARLRVFVEPRADGSPRIEDAEASSLAPSPEGMVLFSAVGATLSPRAVAQLLDAWDVADVAAARAELAEAQLAHLRGVVRNVFNPHFASTLRQLVEVIYPDNNRPAVSDVAVRGTEATSVSDDGDRMSPSDAAGRSPQSEDAAS